MGELIPLLAHEPELILRFGSIMACVAGAASHSDSLQKPCASLTNSCICGFAGSVSV
jgi:hypothetical protein